MDIKTWVIEQIEKINFEKEFVKCGENVYTYNTFFGFVNSIYNKLASESKFEKVIAVMENGLELFSLYFVCMLNGKIIIPIDSQKSNKEIDDLISQNIENAIVISDEQKEKWPCVLTQDIKNIIENHDCVEKMKSNVLSKMSEADFDASFLITFTSGTSGNSKGVIHSLGNLFQTSKSFAKITPIIQPAVFGHIMPMTYMAGILNSIIKPFVFGAKIVLLGRFGVPLALRFWNIVNANEINVMWMSPTMLNMIIKTDRGIIGKNYCSNKELQIFVGTAPLMPALKKEFEEKYNVILLSSYGLTETLFISVDTVETSGLCDGNVGKLLPGVEIIEKDKEALLRVPWMYKGYTNEDTAAYFWNDYYKSGDLINVENDILYITGRKKDLIVKGGLNISPVKIEEEIVKLQEIDDAAVFGRTSDLEELICCAYVTSSAEERQSIERKVNKAVEESLGKTHTIDKFYCIDKMLYNLNGKKDKKQIQNLVEGK